MGRAAAMVLPYTAGAQVSPQTKRGFTVTELLTAISVIAALAAISYPVFVQVRRSSQKSVCMSNLHQIGVAIELYRQREGGAESGTPVQMGLPPGASVAGITGTFLWCHGSDPEGGLPGYHMMWPDPDATDQAIQIWRRYIDVSGPAAVFMYDPNHQPSAGPRSDTWENWTALGLKLDTSVITRTRLGYPHTDGWWLSR